MADYFTNFSVVIPFQHSSHIKAAVTIAEQARHHRFEDEPLPKDFPASLVEVVEDWSFETDATEEGLWLHSDSGGIDAVCVFIQFLLVKFIPTSSVELEWSHDCSKPKMDAFGGGAAYITATDIKTINTSEWLRSVAA